MAEPGLRPDLPHSSDHCTLQFSVENGFYLLNAYNSYDLRGDSSCFQNIHLSVLESSRKQTESITRES